MGGGSVAGVKLPSVDDVVNAGIKVATTGLTGGTNLLAETEMVKQIGKDIEGGVQGLGQNIERNVQNIGTGAAMIASGNWNNADRFLFDVVAASMTGGASLAVNPDEVSEVKQTSVERFVEEEQAAAEQAEQDMIRKVEEERVSRVNEFIGSSIKQRMNAPGRAQTLLTQRNTGGTLLTRV